MNWTRDKSVRLSKVCTVVCGAALGLLCVGTLAGWPPLRYSRPVRSWYSVSLLLFAVPAYTALTLLYRLLNRLGRGLVFVPDNVRCLRVLSWCCFAAAAVFAGSCVYSANWAFLVLAAAFGGLILRVIKNVFAAAVALQDEQDLTI